MVELEVFLLVLFFENWTSVRSYDTLIFQFFSAFLTIFLSFHQKSSSFIDAFLLPRISSIAFELNTL